MGSPFKRPHLDVEHSSPLAQRNSSGSHHDVENDSSHSTGDDSEQIEEWPAAQVER